MNFLSLNYFQIYGLFPQKKMLTKIYWYIMVFRSIYRSFHYLNYRLISTVREINNSLKIDESPLLMVQAVCKIIEIYLKFRYGVLQPPPLKEVSALVFHRKRYFRFWLQYLLLRCMGHKKSWIGTSSKKLFSFLATVLLWCMGLINISIGTWQSSKKK